MKTYQFNTANINSIFDLCDKILDEQSFEVLDRDKRTLMLDAIFQETKFFSRHLHLQLNHLDSNKFELLIEARSIGLELKKDPKNKKLEQQFVRAFHKAIIELNGTKTLAQSA